LNSVKEILTLPVTGGGCLPSSGQAGYKSLFARGSLIHPHLGHFSSSSDMVALQLKQQNSVGINLGCFFMYEILQSRMSMSNSLWVIEIAECSLFKSTTPT